MSKDNLKYDLETMRSVSIELDNDAQELSMLGKNLVSRLDSLRKIGWKSDAGKKFMDELEDGWTKDIERYADLISDLATIIEYAIAQYQVVNDQAKKIKYQTQLQKLSDITPEKYDASTLRNKY